ncbi:MAG: DUF3592 domain-containing protein [Bacilli bacterium]|nr:DUF3592 domain-containing protein [Bacilli bacterium]
MQKFLGIIVGIIFLAVGIFMFIKNNNLVKNCTVEVEATVVDMKQELSTDSDDMMTYMYYPIIEYQVGEDTIRETMSNGSSTPEYSINERLTILYNPNKTTEFIVKGDKTSSIFSIVFMVLGVFVTGYGIVMVVKKD